MHRLRFLNSLWSAAVVAVLMLSCLTAWGQQTAPTSDQIEIFRDLTPEQQRDVLEAMSKEDGGEDVKRDKDLKSPDTVKPRSSFEDKTTDEEIDSLLGTS